MFQKYNSVPPEHLMGASESLTTIFRDGQFDIQGGAGNYEKNSSFPYISEKIKMSSTKLKIKSLFFIQ